jgi:hypothetical protein
MRGAQPDDQTGNAAHTQSVLPVAGYETFVPSGIMQQSRAKALTILECRVKYRSARAVR